MKPAASVVYQSSMFILFISVFFPTSALCMFLRVSTHTCTHRNSGSES